MNFVYILGFSSTHLAQICCTQRSQKSGEGIWFTSLPLYCISTASPQLYKSLRLECRAERKAGQGNLLTTSNWCRYWLLLATLDLADIYMWLFLSWRIFGLFSNPTIITTAAGHLKFISIPAGHLWFVPRFWGIWGSTLGLLVLKLPLGQGLRQPQAFSHIIYSDLIVGELHNSCCDELWKDSYFLNCSQWPLPLRSALIL